MNLQDNNPHGLISKANCKLNYDYEQKFCLEDRVHKIFINHSHINWAHSPQKDARQKRAPTHDSSSP